MRCCRRSGSTPAQELYDDKPDVWDSILSLAVQDLHAVQDTGVRLENGERLYPVVLGNKGDWSYLAPCLSLSVRRHSEGMLGLAPVSGYVRPPEKKLPSRSQR